MFSTLEQSLGTKEAVVVSATPYNHNGSPRLQIKARKAKGKKVYSVVMYENGLFSSAV